MPWTVAAERASSKLEMQAELHLAHGNLHVSDLPGSILVDCGIRQAKINVVEDIKGVGAKLKRAALPAKQIFR